jgi:hypothetical protein
LKDERGAQARCTARARTCGNSSGLFHGIKNHFTKAVTRMCGAVRRRLPLRPQKQNTQNPKMSKNAAFFRLI